MACEVCGAEEPLVEARIEGSVMNVCRNCARYGMVVGQPLPPEPEERQAAAAPMPKPKPTYRSSVEQRLTPRSIEQEEVLIAGYGSIVREAREKRSWSQKDLGKKVNERESIIHKVERDEIQPTESLKRRLERALGITLSAKPAEVLVSGGGESQPLTLEDIARRKK